MKKRILIVIFVVVLLGVGTLVYFGQRSVQLRELYYSGTVEATTSELAFRRGGPGVRPLLSGADVDLIDRVRRPDVEREPELLTHTHHDEQRVDSEHGVVLGRGHPALVRVQLGVAAPALLQQPGPDG